MGLSLTVILTEISGQTANLDRAKTCFQAGAPHRERRTGILKLLDSHRACLEARERAVGLRGAAWRSALELERALGPSERPNQ